LFFSDYILSRHAAARLDGMPITKGREDYFLLCDFAFTLIFNHLLSCAVRYLP
jgi:hypothetical protein